MASLNCVVTLNLDSVLINAAEHEDRFQFADLSGMLQLSCCIGLAPVCVSFEPLGRGDVITGLGQDLVDISDGADGLIDLDRKAGDGRRVQVHRSGHTLKLIPINGGLFSSYLL